MGRTPWMTYLWPGLPELVRQGSWSALAVACGFCVLVNLGLAASFLWDELLSRGMRNFVWLTAVVFWGGAAILSYLSDERSPSQRKAGSDRDTFASAVEHYLKGNWFEAERVLYRLLRKDPRDMEAGLMLATLLRHTGRVEEALRRLDRLERLEGHRRWELEIGRERERLQEAQAANRSPADLPVAA